MMLEVPDSEAGNQKPEIGSESADGTDHLIGQEGDERQPEAGSEPSPAAEELDDVEHQGKTYKIPKALKGALLLQDDYARKVQELDEQRRSHEEQARQLAERQKLESEFIAEIGRIAACDDTIARLDNVDWAAIWNSNRDLYHQMQFQLQQAKDAKQKALNALQQKVTEREAGARSEAAKQLEQFRSAVRREIPELNSDLAGKLNAFALTLGFTADELSQVRDPRLIRMLHAAYTGAELKKAQAAAKAAGSAQAAKPLPTVGGQAAQPLRPTDPASDRLSTEEWARRRTEQVRKRPR